MPRATALLPLVALPLVLACSKGTEEDPTQTTTPEAPTTSATPVEDTLARDRLAALVAKEEWAAARRTLAPLVERENAAFEDLIAAAVTELKALQPPEEAEPYLERARALRPDAAAVAFLDGRLDDLRGELEAAIVHYRAALTAAPDDPGTKYVLASDLDQTDMDGTRLAEAVELYKELEALGIEHGGPWYVSSIYKLYQAHVVFMEDPDPAEAQRYEALWDTLQALGHKSLSDRDLNEGELARILPPPAIGNHLAGAVAAPTFEAAEVLAPELGGGEELLALDLDGDRQADLASAGADGVWVCLRDDVSGAWLEPVQVHEGPARLLRAIDLFKDDSLDLLFAAGDRLVLLECSGGASEEAWSASPLELPPLPEEPGDLELVDYDHDGDLDLLLVAGGARLWRNDGAGSVVEGEPRGSFTDVTEELGWDDTLFTWCAIEDLDADQDIDLLLGGPAGLRVLSSERGGRFTDVTAETFGAVRFAEEPLLVDADGDARPDVLAHGAPATLLLQQPDGRFEARPAAGDLPAGAQPLEVDVDLDGRVDAVWATDGGAAAGLLALGSEESEAVTLGEVGAGPLAVADVTAFVDARTAAPTYELLRLGAEGVQVHRADDVGNGVRLRFRGKKDNRQGLGAVVELRAGRGYRRQLFRGATTIYGLGDADYADVLRITWPNGVVQNELDVEKGAQILDGAIGEQAEGLIGSCPFLYTWNGETFTFISDVLGITPLGLPMAPGMLVPPDHDEYVLVRGDQLVPNADGELVLQFTEELREVTYLDRVRLDVVDHPAGSEVQPNERFCFPPFPEPRTHVMGTLLAPTQVTGSDGEDWTEALASVDDVHAAPFRPLEDGQFLGLAEPHWLELAFDPSEIAGASELRLVCTGWFYWTDASVNVAAARTPGVEFVPPIIQVPGEGGWRPIGPPVGFPAGKTKAMVIDLSEALSREDPRLRIGSSLRLYWDSIRLAVGGDEAQRTTSIEPRSARLWPRGFSAPLASGREDLPERFDWDVLAPRARWNQHPGMYTRFGEVLPLVTEVDDQLVVMGSGDALTVTFDAAELPELQEGWTRSYLVFLDGWAKDRDPNTVEALEVEPLPFHGMSAYPYGEDESFPDTPEHRAWRAEWQTREAFQGVVPLAPTRLEEWSRRTLQR